MLYSSKGDEGGRGSLRWIIALVIFRAAVWGSIWPSGWRRGDTELFLAQWFLGLHWAILQHHSVMLLCSLQHKLNCGVWWEPSSDFCLLHVSLPINNGTVHCHVIHWPGQAHLLFLYMFLMWNRKTILDLHPANSHRNIMPSNWKICLDPITEPKHNTCFVLPFTVTLCSPVPGWVYRSICMDTSPTGSSTPEPVEENWHPPCMHRLLLIGIHLCHVASADNSIFTGHLP